MVWSGGFQGWDLYEQTEKRVWAKFRGFVELCGPTGVLKGILMSLETHQKIYESECGMRYLLYSNVFWQTSFQ